MTLFLLLIIKKFKNLATSEANISVSSISDITGIPRATCIRKLDTFVKMKILQKDEKSKRYSLVLSQTLLIQCYNLNG